MIRIYKDKDIKVVTKGAYETFYKSLGYNIIIEATPTTITEIAEEKVEEKEMKTIADDTNTIEAEKNTPRVSSTKKNKKDSSKKNVELVKDTDII